MEIEVLAIEIDVEPIELCKLLKIANLVGGGGEAKMVISEGYVYLNGEVEFQKRKKVYCEDIVQFNDEAIMPILSDTVLPEGSIIEKDVVDNNSETIALETENKKQQAQVNKKSPKSKGNTKNSSNKTKKGNKSAKSNSPKANPKKENLTNPKTGRKSISF